MLDLLQTLTIGVLAVTCIVQSTAIGNLRRAIGYNTEAINTLTNRGAS